MMFCLSGRQGTISSGGRRLSLIFQMLGNLSAVIPCPLAVSRDIIDDERYNGHHEWTARTMDTTILFIVFTILF